MWNTKIKPLWERYLRFDHKVSQQARSLKLPRFTAITVLSIILLPLIVLAVIAAYSVLSDTITGPGQETVARGPNLGVGALITALLGAPFLIWSTLIKHRSLETAQTALFNDKLNAALQGLHAMRQISEPGKTDTRWEEDIVQRNGAIDSLEGLVKERPSEAARIASILSVYVRELSKTSTPKDVTSEAEAHALRPFRSDVERAAQTLGRLQTIAPDYADSFQIDLRDANLQGFDLKRSVFRNARFEFSRCEGAALSGSDLQEAKFKGAKLHGAWLHNTKLKKASFMRARMKWAWMLGVELDNANFFRADLQGAKLFIASHVIPHPTKTVTYGSNTHNAVYELRNSFGDGSTELNAKRPAGWRQEELSVAEYEDAYRDAFPEV